MQQPKHTHYKITFSGAGGRSRPFLSCKCVKGLTLIETVVAMVIATITFVGFLQVCNTAALMLRNIKYRMRAINIAQAEIEDLKALGCDGIDTSAFTPYRRTYVVIDERLTTSSDDDIIGEMRTRVRNVLKPPLNGKKIVVEVMWELLGESKSDLLETLIYSHQ